jgi:hypothetical protein
MGWWYLKIIFGTSNVHSRRTKERDNAKAGEAAGHDGHSALSQRDNVTRKSEADEDVFWIETARIRCKIEAHCKGRQ